MKKALYILIILLSMSICNKISAYTEYKIGDVVTYNGMNFYVIKDSSSDEISVTMLKAEPLTVEEVNRYGGVGTANNHVNMYNCQNNDSLCYRTSFDINSYGGMAYYTSANCGFGTGSNNTDIGCTTAYSQSEVKYVVDGWKKDQVPSATETRLITLNEVTDLGYEYFDNGSIQSYNKTESTPGWLYNSNYWYWTMTPKEDSDSSVWAVFSEGSLHRGVVYNFYSNTYRYGVVRPVITLKKTVLGDKDESVIVDKDNETVDNKTDTKDNIDDNKTNQTKTTVKVDNTYMSSSILLILLGFITASISVFVLYKLSNKRVN